MIKKKKKKFNMRPKNPRKKEGSTSTTKEPINEKGKKNSFNVAKKGVDKLF